MGISPRACARWFQRRYGMTFFAWCRSRRLAEAFTRIREGADLNDVALEHGYASHSGFREAFGQTFGQPPGRSKQTHCVVTAMLDSPLGRLLAAATDSGICLLEYTDRRMHDRNLATMRRRFAASVVPGRHEWLQRLNDELAAYFDGRLTEFTIPVSPRDAVSRTSLAGTTANPVWVYRQLRRTGDTHWPTDRRPSRRECQRPEPNQSFDSLSSSHRQERQLNRLWGRPVAQATVAGAGTQPGSLTSSSHNRRFGQRVASTKGSTIAARHRGLLAFARLMRSSAESFAPLVV